MKKIYFILVVLFFNLGLKAQVIKTIENVAGKLDSLLTQEELNTITDLTITGTINALDFKTMRDQMPVLSSLDMSAATILGYYGWDGPDLDFYLYEKDAIPTNSFFIDGEPTGKASLTSVILPSGITEIRNFAFARCTGLTSIKIPPLVKFIGFSCFEGCTNLTSDLQLPSVTLIGRNAFEGCSSLKEVSMPSITEIQEYAFNNCSSLTALIIPPTLKYIPFAAFNGCQSLNTITVETLEPPSLADNLFLGVDKTACVVHVPYGTKERYASATEWKTFKNIIEDEQGFLISSNSLRFEVTGGSKSAVNINADVAWTAQSDQSWLSVNPSSGNNSQTLTISAQANATAGARTGLITFSAAGFPSQTIQVTQASPSKTVNITPDGLKDALTEEEKATISNLIITGTMDMRDFWIIKYKMPMLSQLDLSGVSIVSYKETSTSCRYDVFYPANTLPGITPYCPNYNLPPLDSLVLPNTLVSIGYYALGSSRISSIVIPPSVISIESAAFKDCKLLTSVSIPSSVKVIAAEAFAGCTSLKTIELPPSVTYINGDTFSQCTSLTSVEIPSTVTTIGGGTFAGCTSLKEISLPPSLLYIGYEAFAGCSALTSVVIPSSVIDIDGYAFLSCTSLRTVSILPSFDELLPFTFNNCTSLSAIYFYNPIPPRIGLDDPLHGVSRSNCTLYVPFGSAAMYAAAPVWKDFTHIVEMAEFRVSPAAITLKSDQETTSADVTAVGTWTATVDQPWLHISPTSGTGSVSVTITADANPSLDKRTGMITFSSGNASPQIIVRQQGVPLTVEVTSGNLASEFTTDALRNVNHLTVTGTMDARDFKFIRDELPYLIDLDLTGVTITAYSGKEGPLIPENLYPDFLKEEDFIYPANGLPAMAFCNKYPDFTNVKLPASLTSIGTKAFFYCTGITNLEIPSSVTSIGNSAFSLCTGLKNVTLPPGLTTIAYGLFGSCSELTSLVLPPAVTKIGDEAFSGCQSLPSMEIPSLVTSIGKHAFEACYDLKSITLPASLDSIKEWAFSSTGLTSIRIPASVKYIGSRAFFACYGFIDFYAFPVIPPDLSLSPEVFYYLDQTKCILYVPRGSRELYAVADQWKDFTHIEEMGDFDLSDSQLSMEADPSIQSIQITTEIEWNAVCDKDWLTVSPASGDASETISLSCLKNTSPEPRTAIVTFSDANGYSKALTITQKARVNTLPLANAGPDQQVEEGEMVQLDGTGSSDADGDGLTYKWRAPDGITLSATNDAKPSFTAPGVKRDTTYTFKLVVNDGIENSVSDQVLISVTHKSRELTLSADTVVFESRESSAKIMVFGNAPWTIRSDPDWLSITPLWGEGSTEITMTALANESFAERKTTVTVSSTETDAKTLIIIQHGLITGMDQLVSKIALTCYPNPFTTELAIEVINPSLKDITVEIFSMSGQKIKALAKGQKGTKINCTWNGRDESGKQVPGGMYLLMVNGEIRKVVKR